MRRPGRAMNGTACNAQNNVCIKEINVQITLLKMPGNRESAQTLLFRAMYKCLVILLWNISCTNEVWHCHKQESVHIRTCETQKTQNIRFFFFKKTAMHKRAHSTSWGPGHKQAVRICVTWWTMGQSFHDCHQITAGSFLAVCVT